MSKSELQLATAWKDIKEEYGVSKREFGKKISFVKNQYTRDILFRDIAQAYMLAHSGFNKPAVIMAGSVLEELLRLYLESKGVNLQGNTLNGYIVLCEQQGLLKIGVSKLVDATRHFRNLVHLQNEKSNREAISQPTAKGAVSSIFTIANDFTK
jgi:hypothetical protein